MSIVKISEVIAESETGWEDAAQQAVKQAAKTVRNIKHVYIETMQAIVENDTIVKYRVNAKLSFVVDEG